MYRKTPSPLVEALESRTFLSAAPSPGAIVDQAAAVSLRTTTTLKVSKRSAILGQPLKFSITVKAAKGAPAPAGTIQLIDNGTVVSGASEPLVLTLSPAGRAAYTFAVGNIAIYAGGHTFSALYTSTSSELGSISKAVTALVKVPKLKRAVDGLATATVQNGHGAPITDGKTATVLYTGFLQGNGAVFDYATADHGEGAPPNLTFEVDATPEQVVNGFDRGVRGMKVGETRVVVIPAALAYGPFGSGSSVPVDADLVFLVKLQAIT